MWSGKALFTVVAWGASFVLVRVALESFTPFGLVAIRFASGTAVLLLISRLRGGTILPDRRDRPICVFLGLLLGAHLAIQAFGLQYTSAIHTAWIIAFIPAMLAVGAQLFLRQRLRSVGWLGVVVATAGVLTVTMSALPDFSRARLGDLLQLSTCLTWTVYTLAATRAVARNGALRVTVLSVAVAAAVLLVVAGGYGFVRGAVTPGSLLSVAFLGFVCSGLGYFFWFHAVDEHGAARVGSYIYLEPFVTLAVARAMLNEPVTLAALAGGACVLCGVWLVARGTARPRYTESE
jgi:drug/metabolite transporter (DMT)-like permease